MPGSDYFKGHCDEQKQLAGFFAQGSSPSLPPHLPATAGTACHRTPHLWALGSCVKPTRVTGPLNFRLNRPHRPSFSHYWAHWSSDNRTPPPANGPRAREGGNQPLYYTLKRKQGEMVTGYSPEVFSASGELSPDHERSGA